MEIGLSGYDGKLLHGLLEDVSDDIVIRLDDRGFVAHASANGAEIGLDPAAQLLPPHITDLVGRDHAALVAECVSGVLAGQPLVGWIEFPVIACPPLREPDGLRHRHSGACQRWYALSLRPLRVEETQAPQGALGLLRSVQQIRSLEGELHARAVTDPLTGLANRQALCASLSRHLAQGGGQVIAVLAIDGLRALGLRHGQRSADDVLWGFARFVESMLQPGSELAQLDSERLAVVLPGTGWAAALQWCEELLATFAALAASASPRGLKLTASAGLARVECTTDWTLREAELGLVLARAAGGGQAMRRTLPGRGLRAGHGAALG